MALVFLFHINDVSFQVLIHAEKKKKTNSDSICLMIAWKILGD